MRLQLNISPDAEHTETATCCRWTPKNELYTCADDRSMLKWSMDGECVGGKVATLDSYATSMDWSPSIGRQRADTFAVSCTDGSFRIFGSGREEKRVTAHKGAAVISLRWSHDGSAIATAGEDGAVKLWSRVGMQRSVIAQQPSPVYCVAWGPDNDQILYSSGRKLFIQAVQRDRKLLQWKAHDATVLAADWNPVNGRIVSGGEDCRYRVWDAFGRQLFQSQPYEHVITSVKWAPHGNAFAVGAFGMLRLCDKTGWSHCREAHECGSVFDISWTGDGTLLAGATGSGSVIFAQTVQRYAEWKHISAVLTDATQIQITDNLNNAADFVETLEFRDRVVEFSVAHEYLVVATSTQIYIYSVNNFNTPHIFDTSSDSLVNLIVQSSRHFCIADNVRGLQIYSYEGRKVCSPMFPGIRVDFLDAKTLSLCGDAIAVLDYSDNKTVRIMDSSTGRAIGPGKFTHTCEIVELRLSQMPGSQTRFLACIDRARDLHLIPVTADAKDSRKPVKLQTMVDSVGWSDVSDVLVTLTDGKMVTWYYPQGVWVDRDLVEQAKESSDRPDFGKIPQIVSFHGTQLSVRRSDGALLTAGIPCYPSMIYDFVKNTRWEAAIRLCRFVKSEALWATLASMAIEGRHLDTAEIALADIGFIDKLNYIMYIKDIPSEKGKMAELALYRKDPETAEQILLHAKPPLVYRAIKLNVRISRWERALALAAEHKQHIDTVLWYRSRYLNSIGRSENSKAFLKYSDVEVDEDKVKAKKAAEREREARGGGRRVANEAVSEDEHDDAGHK